MDDLFKGLGDFAAQHEAQVRLGKHMAALELTRLEREIAVAEARQKVAETTIESLELQLNAPAPLSEAESNHLKALLVLAIAQRDAHRNEITALASYLEIKTDMATQTLGIDSSAMTTMLNKLKNEDDEPGV